VSLVNFPISLEGLAAAYNGIDQNIGQVTGTGWVLVGWHIRRTDDTTSELSASFAIDTVPSGPMHILAGDSDASDTGLTQALSNGEVLAFHMTSGVGMNVNGYLQVEIPDGGGTPPPLPIPQAGDLTTLASVKSFLGITGTTFDTYLQLLITGVSTRMQKWMDRTIGSTVVVGEKIDSAGGVNLLVNGWPLISVEEVRIAGAAESGVTFNASSGTIRRTLDDGAVVAWPWGFGVVEADYTYGYDAVPMDLQEACDWQVAWDFGLSGQDQKRLGLGGTVLPEGGTSAYIPNTAQTGGWVVSTLDTMRRYQRLPEPM